LYYQQQLFLQHQHTLTFLINYFLDHLKDLYLVDIFYLRYYKFLQHDPLHQYNIHGMFIVSLTVTDMDGDDDMEILIAYYTNSKDYVDIFHHNGTSFLDWPYTFPGPQTYMCPVVGDVDSDGDFEIFNGGHIVDGPSFLGRHHTGMELEGLWPAIVDGAECSPIIYDIDNDDEPEIIIGDNNVIPTGSLFAFNPDGSIVEGWPIKTSGGSGLGSPCIGDVDLDGDTEIGLVSGYCGTVNLWTFDDVPFNPDKVIWGTHFHDIWNTGCYHTPAPR